MSYQIIQVRDNNMSETKQKILIVDDEPQNVLLMNEILSFHPEYECRGAMSGLEALASLKIYFPEIIFVL